jgi:hypothetical protein
MRCHKVCSTIPAEFLGLSASIMLRLVRWYLDQLDVAYLEDPLSASPASIPQQRDKRATV